MIDASNGEAAGVTSALRFWVMESSIEPREIRRKSALAVRGCLLTDFKPCARLKIYIPLSATVEKQKCGVRCEGRLEAVVIVGSDVLPVLVEPGVCDGSDQSNFARL